MPNIVHLTGCAPTPLAHYLKALGILRLVAEQKDENACGYWQGEHFVLESALDEQGVVDFFLHGYQPTPIVAPWNGGSGFYPKDNTVGIAALANTACTRFDAYKQAIQAGRLVLTKLKLDAKPEGETKVQFMVLLRSIATESYLAWMDAAVLLSGDGPSYPPLLGTGGNDGRLDFTNNFMQRIIELFDAQSGHAKATTRNLLETALKGCAGPGLVDRAVGFFSPGAIGGANATSGFETGSLTNPWDYVLMLEGALMFAAAATRRHESSDAATLAYPFTVRATGAGSGASALSDEAGSRGEIWMPLWDAPLGYAELRQLMSEGRATLGRRSVRDGLDFSRAVSSLGVDRGISSFQRYGFLVRNGLAFLASPLSRIPVRRDGSAELMADLDGGGWLERIRRQARKEAPARYQSSIHRLEDKIFNLSRQSAPLALQALLECLGELLPIMAKSAKVQDAIYLPMPRLSSAWVLQADDGSHEFRIATALAGIWAKDLPMCVNLLPVSADGKTWIKANDARRSLCVWGEGALERNLLAVLRRRLMEAERRGLDRKPFHFLLHADSAAVAAFLRRDTNDDRIARLLVALSFAEMPDTLPKREVEADNDLPAAYAILKPLFVDDGTLNWMRLLPEGRNLPLSQTIPNLLGAGRVDEAVRTAWHRQRASGLHLPRGRTAPPASLGIDGPRLAAALMIPLPISDLNRLFVHLTREEPEEIPE